MKIVFSISTTDLTVPGETKQLQAGTLNYVLEVKMEINKNNETISINCLKLKFPYLIYFKVYPPYIRTFCIKCNQSEF